MRVAFGIEQFDDCRDRCYGHHDQMSQTVPVNSDEELAKTGKRKRTVGRKKKKKTERLTHRRLCGKRQLFFLREALHGHDVKPPASPIAQLGEGVHQTRMVIGDDVSPNALTRYVRDDDLLDTARGRRSAGRALVSARANIDRALGHAHKAQHVAAHRVPPTTLEEPSAPGALDDALDGLGGRALCALAALRPSECGAAVGKENGIEPPRAPAALTRAKRGRGHAVHPVWSRLDCERRPPRAKEEKVHPGPVAPFLSRGVREDGTFYGGYGSVGRSTSVGSVPKRPSANEKLGAKVVVMSEDCFFFQV